MIVGNHGHDLTVPMADVTAAMDKTYSIQGASGHAHDITITAADFATLAGGSAVTVTSTEGSAHTHDVTVTLRVTRTHVAQRRISCNEAPDAPRQGPRSLPAKVAKRGQNPVEALRYEAHIYGSLTPSNRRNTGWYYAGRRSART